MGAGELDFSEAAYYEVMTEEGIDLQNGEVYQDLASAYQRSASFIIDLEGPSASRLTVSCCVSTTDGSDGRPIASGSD